MLQIQGVPSRQSLLHEIQISNTHLFCGKDIQALYELIEVEQSPFTISKECGPLLDRCLPGDMQKKYKHFLLKTLAVRVIQKCKTYFKSMKLDYLTQLLAFYGGKDHVETLLYECNREGLVNTVIDHQANSLTFDVQEETAENLLKYGDALRKVHQKVSQAMEAAESRKRIFAKVKEQMIEEKNQIEALKKRMSEQKKDVLQGQQDEENYERLLQEAREREKQQHSIQESEKMAKEREKNKLLEILELTRRIRIKEVL